MNDALAPLVSARGRRPLGSASLGQPRRSTAGRPPAGRARWRGRPIPSRSRSGRSAGSSARREETRFGRDHGSRSIRSVADFQTAVPLRTYEDLWRDYLQRPLPGLRRPDLARAGSPTWP